jgi:hypothetical protein
MLGRLYQKDLICSIKIEQKKQKVEANEPPMGH